MSNQRQPQLQPQYFETPKSERDADEVNSQRSHDSEESHARFYQELMADSIARENNTKINSNNNNNNNNNNNRRRQQQPQENDPESLYLDDEDDSEDDIIGLPGRKKNNNNHNKNISKSSPKKQQQQQQQKQKKQLPDDFDQQQNNEEDDVDLENLLRSCIEQARQVQKQNKTQLLFSIRNKNLLDNTTSGKENTNAKKQSRLPPHINVHQCETVAFFSHAKNQVVRCCKICLPEYNTVNSVSRGVGLDDYYFVPDTARGTTPRGPYGSNHRRSSLPGAPHLHSPPLSARGGSVNGNNNNSQQANDNTNNNAKSLEEELKEMEQKIEVLRQQHARNLSQEDKRKKLAEKPLRREADVGDDSEEDDMEDAPDSVNSTNPQDKSDIPSSALFVGGPVASPKLGNNNENPNQSVSFHPEDDVVSVSTFTASQNPNHVKNNNSNNQNEVSPRGSKLRQNGFINKDSLNEDQEQVQPTSVSKNNNMKNISPSRVVPFIAGVNEAIRLEMERLAEENNQLEEINDRGYREVVSRKIIDDEGEGEHDEDGELTSRNNTARDAQKNQRQREQLLPATSFNLSANSGSNRPPSPLPLGPSASPQKANGNNNNNNERSRSPLADKYATKYPHQIKIYQPGANPSDPNACGVSPYRNNGSTLPLASSIRSPQQQPRYATTASGFSPNYRQREDGSYFFLDDAPAQTASGTSTASMSAQTKNTCEICGDLLCAPTGHQDFLDAKARAKQKFGDDFFDRERKDFSVGVNEKDIARETCTLPPLSAENAMRGAVIERWEKQARYQIESEEKSRRLDVLQTRANTLRRGEYEVKPLASSMSPHRNSPSQSQNKSQNPSPARHNHYPSGSMSFIMSGNAPDNNNNNNNQQQREISPSSSQQQMNPDSSFNIPINNNASPYRSVRQNVTPLTPSKSYVGGSHHPTNANTASPSGLASALVSPRNQNNNNSERSLPKPEESSESEVQHGSAPRAASETTHPSKNKEEETKKDPSFFQRVADAVKGALGNDDENSDEKNNKAESPSPSHNHENNNNSQQQPSSGREDRINRSPTPLSARKHQSSNNNNPISPRSADSTSRNNNSAGPDDAPRDDVFEEGPPQSARSANNNNNNSNKPSTPRNHLQQNQQPLTPRGYNIPADSNNNNKNSPLAVSEAKTQEKPSTTSLDSKVEEEYSRLLAEAEKDAQEKNDGKNRKSKSSERSAPKNHNQYHDSDFDSIDDDDEHEDKNQKRNDIDQDELDEIQKMIDESFERPLAENEHENNHNNNNQQQQQQQQTPPSKSNTPPASSNPRGMSNNNNNGNDDDDDDDDGDQQQTESDPTVSSSTPNNKQDQKTPILSSRQNHQRIPSFKKRTTAIRQQPQNNPDGAENSSTPTNSNNNNNRSQNQQPQSYGNSPSNREYYSQMHPHGENAGADGGNNEGYDDENYDVGDEDIYGTETVPDVSESAVMITAEDSPPQLPPGRNTNNNNNSDKNNNNSNNPVSPLSAIGNKNVDNNQKPHVQEEQGNEEGHDKMKHPESNFGDDDHNNKTREKSASLPTTSSASASPAAASPSKTLIPPIWGAGNRPVPTTVTNAKYQQQKNPEQHAYYLTTDEDDDDDHFGSKKSNRTHESPDSYNYSNSNNNNHNNNNNNNGNSTNRTLNTTTGSIGAESSGMNTPGRKRKILRRYMSEVEMEEFAGRNEIISNETEAYKYLFEFMASTQYRVALSPELMLGASINVSGSPGNSSRRGSRSVNRNRKGTPKKLNASVNGLATATNNSNNTNNNNHDDDDHDRDDSPSPASKNGNKNNNVVG